MNRDATERAANRYVERTDQLASLTAVLRGHLIALATAENDIAAAERALMITLDAGHDGAAELKVIEAVAARYAAATRLLRDTALALDTLHSFGGE